MSDLHPTSGKKHASSLHRAVLNFTSSPLTRAVLPWRTQHAVCRYATPYHTAPQRRLQLACTSRSPTCMSVDSGGRDDDIGNEVVGDAAYVEARTMAWARTVVVGLQLCPFAEGVLDAGMVRVHVSSASGERAVRKAFGREVEILLRSPASQLGTTLLVLPRFAVEDFRRFHEVCGVLEDEVEGSDALVDEIMLACFHPKHEWRDCETEDAALNFDKRAPYPVVNLLRAAEVDRYVEEGRTQHILQRNQRTLERLGSERLIKLYKALRSEEGGCEAGDCEAGDCEAGD